MLKIVAKRPSRKEVLHKLDNVLHSILQVNIGKEYVVIFFPTCTTRIEMEKFWRQFYIQIKNNGTPKMDSKPLSLIDGLRTNPITRQIFIPISFPAKKGDSVRFHLFGTKGKEFPL